MTGPHPQLLRRYGPDTATGLGYRLGEHTGTALVPLRSFPRTESRER
ncbi:hypothetical protein ACFVJH_20735 [Streptomyces decoyicus]